MRRRSLSLTINELHAFLAATIYMGIVRVAVLDMCWQTATAQPFVSSLFGARRYKHLLRCFCVCDPSNDAVFNDVVQHTAHLFTHLNAIFPRCFGAGRALAIDESIVSFTGRSRLKQYVKGKPHPFGFKVYVVASDHYVRRMKLYPGAADGDAVKQSVHDLCVELMDGI